MVSTVEGSGISHPWREIVVLCNFLLFAGHETTANLIGGSVLHLLQNREQWESLRENAELPGGVVEELLRYVSPVLTISRVLKEDVERHGVTMKKGDRVLLGIGAANHDPAEFPAPSRTGFNSIEPILNCGVRPRGSSLHRREPGAYGGTSCVAIFVPSI